MFQDIAPHMLHIEYDTRPPKVSDYLLVQMGGKILMTGNKYLPTVKEMRKAWPEAEEGAVYLFSIDDDAFYFSPLSSPSPEAGSHLSGCGPEFSFMPIMALRDLENNHHAFGAALSAHLGQWYSRHRFCGACGELTVRSKEERALICTKCGQIYYPRISPVVIIAIVNGDSILLTRYNRSGYRRHALVAGFVEAGETLEDAVRRETMEEVGLKVKNIRYCESQPWPFSSSLIAGFFADADGDATVHLNADGKDELSEAVWIKREDIEIEDSSVSLTWDMIRKFRDQQNP